MTPRNTAMRETSPKRGGEGENKSKVIPVNRKVFERKLGEGMG